MMLLVHPYKVLKEIICVVYRTAKEMTIEKLKPRQLIGTDVVLVGFYEKLLMNCLSKNFDVNSVALLIVQLMPQIFHTQSR